MDADRQAAPEWWPYAREFPCWHVWKGVSQTGFYAWKPMTSPPKVVRGKSAAQLRNAIREAR